MCTLKTINEQFLSDNSIAYFSLKALELLSKSI